MRLYAPLLPYAMAFWLGCTYGLGDLNYKWLIFSLWCIGGCWIGFFWSYRFSSARYILFISCCLIGVIRSFMEINNRPFPDGEFHTFTITSCKPLPVCHGRNIYGYGNTREVGKVAFKWPSDIVFPAIETTAIGYWNEFPENKPTSSFDARRYYEGLGCRGVFTPLATIENINLLTSVQQNNTLPFSYRRRMKTKIESAGILQPAAGFMLGLSTGDKSWIPKPTKYLFSRAGLAHLLAVSGYHVGLVGCLPLLFLRSRRREVRWLSSMGLAGIWGFIIACGSPWSAVRSGIMVTVACIGKWSGRHILPWQGFAIAAWVVAWVDPWAPQQLGTQLSFTATAGILAVISNPRWLIFRIPIAAQTATMAWTAATFHQLPIWFLPLNVIASPIVALIGTFIGAGCLVGELSPSIGKMLLICGGVVANMGLEFLSSLDSLYPLAIHIESGKDFIGTSIVTLGWLFQSSIPMLLARILSATGVAYSSVSLLLLLV
jgi:ComEC/Rec2-related protein